MYSVFVHLWNEIAREQTLATQFGRDLFHLGQGELFKALDEREQALVTETRSGSVIAAFITLAPLLWECEAIAGYCADHDLNLGSLPNVVSVDEALMVADLDYRLSPAEQRDLKGLLEAGDFTLPEATRPKPRAARLQTIPKRGGPAAPTAPKPGLAVVASDLAAAMKPNKPRANSKSLMVVLLSYDPGKSLLTVEEARHARFAFDLPAVGSWSGVAQIDGKALANLAASMPPTAFLELRALGNAVEVRGGNVIASLPRLDGGPGAVTRRHMPPDKRHKGKVEARPEGRRYAPPKGETWGFSAQVPFKTDVDVPEGGGPRVAPEGAYLPTLDESLHDRLGSEVWNDLRDKARAFGVIELDHIAPIDLQDRLRRAYDIGFFAGDDRWSVLGARTSLSVMLVQAIPWAALVAGLFWFFMTFTLRGRATPQALLAIEATLVAPSLLLQQILVVLLERQYGVGNSLAGFCREWLASATIWIGWVGALVILSCANRAAQGVTWKEWLAVLALFAWVVFWVGVRADRLERVKSDRWQRYGRAIMSE